MIMKNPDDTLDGFTKLTNLVSSSVDNLWERLSDIELLIKQIDKRLDKINKDLEYMRDPDRDLPI